MKIKHYSGYGSVTAVRDSKTKGCWDLKIIVTGDHERGILTEDKYTIYNWLVKKFDKRIDDVRWIDWVDVIYDFNAMATLRSKGYDGDVVIYYIRFRNEDYWSGKYRELSDL